MAGIKVDPPPLAVQVVDIRTGYPTRALTDFLRAIWQRTGASDDNDDFILKLVTGSRYQNPKPIEQDDAASLAQMLSMVFSISPGVDPGLIQKAYEARVPTGVIVMWSGDIGSVPKGWALCDGLEGRPNLQDKFVLGAGGSASVGDTGGSNQATVNTGNATTGITASSTANITTNTAEVENVGTPGTGTNAVTSVSAIVDTTINESAHNHSVTIDTVPEWYALAYIIKL